MYCVGKGELPMATLCDCLLNTHNQQRNQRLFWGLSLSKKENFPIVKLTQFHLLYILF